MSMQKTVKKWFANVPRMASISAIIFLAGIFILSIIGLATPTAMGIFSVIAVMAALIKKFTHVDHAIGGLIAMLIFITLTVLAGALGVSGDGVALFVASALSQLVAYVAFALFRKVESQ